MWLYEDVQETLTQVPVLAPRLLLLSLLIGRRFTTVSILVSSVRRAILALILSVEESTTRRAQPCPRRIFSADGAGCLGAQGIVTCGWRVW